MKPSKAFWRGFVRGFLVCYPVGLAALALLRITQGAYETGLYMLTTAVFFAVNLGLQKSIGTLRECATRASALLADMHKTFSDSYTGLLSSIAEARLEQDEIRRIYLSNGFTVKDGQTDLKPYVYDAANALIDRVKQSALAPRAPTDDAEGKPE